MANSLLHIFTESSRIQNQVNRSVNAVVLILNQLTVGTLPIVKGRVDELMLNGTDLRTLITSLYPCAGGLGEALRPPMGGLGGTPPSMVFRKNDYFSLKSVTFDLKGLM